MHENKRHPRPKHRCVFYFYFLPSTSLWGIYSVTCVHPLQYTFHSLSRSFTSLQFYEAFLIWQLKLNRIQFLTYLKLRVLLSVPESVAKWLRHYEHDLEQERIKPNRLNFEQNQSDSTMCNMVPPGQGRVRDFSVLPSQHLRRLITACLTCVCTAHTKVTTQVNKYPSPSKRWKNKHMVNNNNTY